MGKMKGFIRDTGQDYRLGLGVQGCALRHGVLGGGKSDARVGIRVVVFSHLICSSRLE